MEARFECEHCLKKFKSKESRHHHLSRYHGYDPIIYKCTHCPKTFKYKHNYITHLADGHKMPNMRFECGQCTSSFKYSHHLVQHMRLVHDPNKKTYKCTECCKTFERRDGFVQHMRIHAPTVTLHRCELCQRMYRSKAGLTLHINMNHNENFQRSQCPWCPSDFKWPHHLKQHISKVHFRPDESLSDMKYSKSMGNRCGLCMVSFPGKLDLLMHLKNQHDLDVDIYKCCQCTEVYNLKEQLQLHLEKHQENEDFAHKCEQCHPLIDPKLYVDSNDLPPYNPEELTPSDEITDFEVCLMEHPELRRMIKYKMRHAKTNEPFFGGGYFDALSENEDDVGWPIAESTNYNFNDSDESNTTPQAIPEIGVIAAIPDASATTEQVALANENLSEAVSDASEYSLNLILPDSANSTDTVCQFPCNQCEASYETAHSLSKHVKFSHEFNSQAPVKESTTSVELSIQESDSVPCFEEVLQENISEIPIVETLIERNQTADISADDIQITNSSIQEPQNSLVGVSPKEPVNRFSGSSPHQAVGVKDGSNKELVVKLLRLNENEGFTNADRTDNQVKPSHESRIQNLNQNLKCTKCTTVFHDVSALKRHDKEIHSKEKLIFKCEVCNKFFAKKSQLGKHLANHKPGIVIGIPINDPNTQETPKSPKRETGTKKRISGNRKPNIFKCKLCNLTFNAAVEIARHVRLSHKRISRGARIQQKAKNGCKHCSKTFDNPIALSFHARVHIKKKLAVTKKTTRENYDSEKNSLQLSNESNQNDVNENSVIESNESAIVSNADEPSNPTIAEEHAQPNRTNPRAVNPKTANKSNKKTEVVHECGECKLFFTTKVELFRHVSCKHMNIKDVTSEKYAAFKTPAAVGSCDNAGKETSPKDSSHTMPHYCIACDQLFSTESDHIRHMKMEHRHKCGICGIAFVRKEKLKHHMESQHKDRPQQHKCIECDAVFRLEASLARHVDEKHLKAASQGKTGASEPQLVTKEMEKTMHKCVQCNALFPLRESLQRHTQLEHDVGSLHKCGECTAVFNDIEEFKEHLQIEHMKV